MLDDKDQMELKKQWDSAIKYSISTTGMIFQRDIRGHKVEVNYPNKLKEDLKKVFVTRHGGRFAIVGNKILWKEKKGYGWSIRCKEVYYSLEINKGRNNETNVKTESINSKCLNCGVNIPYYIKKENNERIVREMFCCEECYKIFTTLSLYSNDHF